MTNAERELPTSANRNFVRAHTHLVPLLRRLRRFVVLAQGNLVGEKESSLHVVRFDGDRMFAGKALRESVLKDLVSCGEYESELDIPEGAYSYITLVVITKRCRLHLYRRLAVH